MAIRDVFASRLAGPAGRVLDAPIRDIVHEILREHGYASPAEVQALRDELRDLRMRVDGVDRRVSDLSAIAEGARAEAATAQAAAAAARTEAATAQAAAATAQAAAATARAEATPRPEPIVSDAGRTAALEVRVSELEAALTMALAPAPASPLVTDPLVLALEARVLELEAALAARATVIAPAPVAAAPAPPAEKAPAPPAEKAPGQEAAAKAPEAKAPAKEAAAPLSAEPRGTCKVPDCDDAVRSKGFCSPHYQQWRRGTLKGFVNADGTALVDGRVVHLATDAIGASVTARDGRLYVDGKPTKEVPAS
ncbi:MAG: hypothetical protein V4850_07550 [Myxococcota bacterium]